MLEADFSNNTNGCQAKRDSYWSRMENLDLQRFAVTSMKGREGACSHVA